jgi:hypothetical protein
VTWTFCRRLAASFFGCTLAVALTAAAAPAALDMSVGAQRVVKGAAVSDCNAKAKQALSAVLQDPAEIGSGDTGEWKATGAPDSSGNSFAAAAIHCYPLENNSYLVTFTCAAQTPPNADTASALCDKVTSAFGGGH